MQIILISFIVILGAFIVVLEIARRTPLGKMRPVPTLICRLEDMVQDYLDLQEVHSVRKKLEQTALLTMSVPDISLKISNKTIKTETGDIPLRIYQPHIKKPLPVCLFFHSGGFVTGSLNTADNACRKICKNLNVLVISVDYALAPEHPFPKALKQAEESLSWCREFCRQWGGDPEKIIIAGASAGGNIALNLTLKNAAEINAMILMYPWIDLSDTDSGSFQNFREGYLLSREQIIWFRNLYLAHNENTTDPRISPLLSPKLSTLPPTLLYVAEFDVLRDQGHELGHRLKNAGVTIEEILLKGHIHGFFSMFPLENLEINRYLAEGRDFVKRQIHHDF